jgi:hypothetical protein
MGRRARPGRRSEKAASACTVGVGPPRYTRAVRVAFLAGSPCLGQRRKLGDCARIVVHDRRYERLTLAIAGPGPGHPLGVTTSTRSAHSRAAGQCQPHFGQSPRAPRRPTPRVPRDVSVGMQALGATALVEAARTRPSGNPSPAIGSSAASRSAQIPAASLVPVSCMTASSSSPLGPFTRPHAREP